MKDAEKDIGRVVSEVDAMEGVEARGVLAEWMKAARERAMLEQAVTVVKVRVKALELNMVQAQVHMGEAEPSLRNAQPSLTLGA